MSACSFNFTVEDTTPPAIVCPADILVLCDDPTEVSFTPTATDIVDTNVDIVCVPPSGTVFNLGDTMVTCTATDYSGNTDECSFTVTVAAGLPTLRISLVTPSTVLLSWELTCDQYELQSTPNVVPPIIWSPVADPVVTGPNNNSIVLPNPAGQEYFRLIRTP